MSALNTYPEGQPFTGTAGRTAAESVPAWPVPPKPPAGAPNVIVIVLDDLGFAQLGCYGGLGDRLRTPNIDRLAAHGLRYQNFHTTALCSPSRAALLTGRNHHSVGAGIIMERATGYPGYNGRISKDTAMLPAVLADAGYGTMALGKWHLAPDEAVNPAGPFDRWPLGQGFERFYGFMPGETSQWEPDLWEDNHAVDAPARPEDGYHLTVDLVDHAIRWIGERQAVAPSKPFFTYFAFGAMHSPHHAPREYIDAYRGVFDDGWSRIRAHTLRTQKDMGLIAENTVLPPVNPGVTEWDDLSDDQRRLFARQMEVYAGFLTHTDQHIGRLLDHLDSSGLRDNTVVMLLSDNGASAEGGTNGLLNELSYFNGEPEDLPAMLAQIDAWGTPATHPHYASGWAMAGNTPNRWYKSFVHEGGTRGPLIISAPGRIADPGAIRTQFHHLVDIVPTLLDIIGLSWPDTVRGHTQRPVEGVSFAAELADPAEPTHKQSQYFEMFAHRAIWAGGWKAVALHWTKGVLARIGHVEHDLHDGDVDADTWELYHLDDDVSEMHDLAQEQPERLRELITLWWQEADKHQVLPLDDSLLQRLLAARPAVFEARESYRYDARLRLTRSSSPDLRDRSHTITADITVPADGADGVIVSNGGAGGGYALCVADGRVHYVSNHLGRTHTIAADPDPLPPGRSNITVEFTRTGVHAGHARLLIDGRVVDAADVPRTNRVGYAAAEGLEIGSDSVSPVWTGYTSPATFTGLIHTVTIVPKPTNEPDLQTLEDHLRMDMLRQ